MKQQFRVLKAEFVKCKSSHILWVTTVAFAMAPIMGAIFMIIIRNPDALAKAGALSTKMKMMNFSADWGSYLEILTQAVAVGGVLVFGFIASWIFGREYADRTSKDLLALPSSRAMIINAKFIVYIIWCLALVVCNLLVGLLFGYLLQILVPENFSIGLHLSDYFFTTVLVVCLGTPVSFFAVWGKGYMAPLGFVALALVFSQVIAATGYGYYFPWAIPGLFSGAGGEYKDQLDFVSYTIVVLTSLTGYFATIGYLRYADQTE